MYLAIVTRYDVKKKYVIDADSIERGHAGGSRYGISYFMKKNLVVAALDADEIWLVDHELKPVALIEEQISEPRSSASKASKRSNRPILKAKKVKTPRRKS